MAEARELIEDAHESHGSTYFTEDYTDAMDAVKECLQVRRAAASPRICAAC